MSVKKTTKTKAAPAKPKKAAPAEKGTATYLYCLLANKKKPSLAGAPAGVPKLGPPRLIEAGEGLWLLAADAPLSEYAAAPIERRLRDLEWVGRCALGHEALIEHVTHLGTVVPMKLFTLFDGDARAEAHVSRSRADLDRVIERIAGRAEWGLRLRLDEPRALARQKEKSAARGSEKSGVSFLLRKKAEQDASKELLLRARERATGLFDLLVDHADDARRRPATQADAGARILLEAAFLVPNKTQKRFVTAVERAAKDIVDDGYEIELTGPWPAYHFISEGQ